MKLKKKIKKMPNWCSNILEIRGEESEIERFYLENRRKREDNEMKTSSSESDCETDYEPDDEELSFEKSVPIGDDYNRAVTEWGTKWDVGEVILNRTESELIYEFETAWSPPEQWLEKVASKYNTLEFDMESIERGMDFHVFYEFRNGEQIKREFHEHNKFMMEKYGLDKVISSILIKMNKCGLLEYIYEHVYSEDGDLNIDFIYTFQDLFEGPNQNVISKLEESGIYFQYSDIKNMYNGIMDNYDDITNGGECKDIIFYEIHSFFEDKYPLLKRFVSKFICKINLKKRVMEKYKKIYGKELNQIHHDIHTSGQLPPTNFMINNDLFVHNNLKFVENGGFFYRENMK